MEAEEVLEEEAEDREEDQMEVAKEVEVVEVEIVVDLADIKVEEM